MRNGTPKAGELNGRSKLTLKEVEAIRLSPDTPSFLSEFYGIGKTQVWRIKTGVCWNGETQTTVKEIESGAD